MLLNNISLKSKLVFMLLSIAIGCILIIGYQGLTNGEKALKSRIYEQLTSVREAKGYQVEAWYRDIKSQLSSMTESHTTVYAMREFSAAFMGMGNEVSELDEEIEPLRQYYLNEFFPRLRKDPENAPVVGHHLPKRLVSQKLQLEYIANNPAPPGQKKSLVEPETQSYYNAIHAHYHPLFKQMSSSNGFYDIFLVDIDTGDIVYSVEKEVDYATSLKTGPYRNSSLGQLFKNIGRSQNFGEIVTMDYDFYKPSYGQPAMFMGSTIYDMNNKPIGMLIIQVGAERLENIMTGRRGWDTQGLGNTGETFLVGEDRLMRSNARKLFKPSNAEAATATNCYANALYKKLLMDKATADSICQFETSVLLQKVEGSHIRAALSGESGTLETESYTGNEALMAYKPLYLGNMKWAVVASLDTSEANEPVQAFQKTLGVSAILIASAVTFIAMLLAGLFISPLNKLMQGVRKLSDGESSDLHIDLQRNDEYGELAKAMNQAGQTISIRNEQIKEKEDENYQLLLNMFPEKAAKQFASGNTEFSEQVENATVIYIAVRGLNEYTAHTEHASDTIQMYNQLIGEINDLAGEHEIERIKTVGDNYLAACGVNISRLDHARRGVVFSRALLAMIPRFNQSHNTRFSLHIGVHSGSVLSGIAGRNGNFSYNLWGDAVNAAEYLRCQAEPNTVLITEQVYLRLDQSDGFNEYTPLTIPDLGELNTYVYVADSLQLIQGSDQGLPKATQSKLEQQTTKQQKV